MNFRIVDKPGFNVIGRTKQFTTADGANFKLIPLWWNEFLNSPDFEELTALSHQQPGKVTGEALLGIECTLDKMPETYTYIFGEGFPSSGFKHDAVPHLEVYLPAMEGEKMKCDMEIVKKTAL
jgi:AraC family transcriptional regulator